MADTQVVTGYPKNGKVSSPLKSLYESTGNGRFVFPLDLSGPQSTADAGDVSDPFITFKAAKYRRQIRQDIPKKETIVTIHLPIPSNLAVNYTATYNNTDLGVTGGTLVRDAGFIRSAEQLIQGRLSAAVADSSRIDVEQVVREGLAGIGRNIAQGLGTFTGINAFDAAQIAVGKAINPHTAALFTNMTFRQHQFVYKFIARNQKESDVIRSIVNVLRYSMHPQFGEITGERVSSILEYPEQWFISFSKSHRQYLYDFLPAVLTNVAVNYNSSNIPTFFEDTKAPVDIEISMTFQEIEIMTKETLDREDSVRHFSKGRLNE